MLTNPPIPYDFCVQLGKGPSRVLLRDCTTSPINRFAALVSTAHLTSGQQPHAQPHIFAGQNLKYPYKEEEDGL